MCGLVIFRLKVSGQMCLQANVLKILRITFIAKKPICDFHARELKMMEKRLQAQMTMKIRKKMISEIAEEPSQN